MPKINITEVEEASLATFDATENTVLIPILYVRNYNVDENNVWTVDEKYDLSTKKYSNYKTLKADLNKAGGANGRGNKLVYIGTADANKVDASYVMAYECVVHGLNVVLKPIELDLDTVKTKFNTTSNKTILTEKEYHTILEDAISNGCLQEFESRNIYNLKFITSGAYPNTGKCSTKDVEKTVVANDAVDFDENKQIKLSNARLIKSDAEIGDVITVSEDVKCTIGAKLVATAVARQGDAVALIELPRKFESNEALLNELTTIAGGDDYKYAAAFYPWINVTTSAVKDSYQMPACYGYLMAYANSVRSNANWFAAAGTQRGFIPTMVKPVAEVSEALMHALQCDGNDDTYSSYTPNIAVNPIMNTGNYGIRLWGNKVAAAISSVANKYSDYLNVRILVCDLRKQLYHSSLRSTFEPNDDIAWFNFKSLTNTLLERMKSGRGIQWYKWKKDTDADMATIKCSLEIKPIEAVESFDITIVLTDEDVSVSEE